MTLSGATRVYAVLGAPVAHSLSPRLCNHAFASLEVDAVYVALPCDARRPDAVVAGCDALGLAGANVTYPLKTTVLPHLRTVSPAGEAVGAVNVLARAEGSGFVGENTDAPGVPLALRTWLDWDPAGRTAAILGAGGAARAAAYGLLETGAAAVTLLVRDAQRAEDGLAGLRAAIPDRELHVAELSGAAARAALRDADLVVQATPVGLGDPDARPLVDPDDAPRAAGFELNYGSRPTAFARAWRAAGRGCLDGRDLLAAQARLALEVWLGRSPALAELRGLLDEGGEDAS